jgi:RNA polymerase sigma-70 factor (ECF subfamily)
MGRPSSFLADEPFGRRNRSPRASNSLMADLAAVIDANDRGLRALAFRLLGDRDAMDDVLQEAYAKAFRGVARFRGESSASTWLYRIVYNACLDQLRRRTSEELPVDAPASTVDLDLRLDLAHALGALAPDERAAVLLVDANGFDYATAARILGIPAGTLASRLNRARAELRATLAAEGAPHVRS